MTFVGTGGGGGGGGGYTSVAIKTEANDGDTLAVDELSVFANSVDMNAKLPPVAGLALGSKVYVAIANGGQLTVLDCDDRGGADLEQIAGEGNSGAGWHPIVGEDGQRYDFEYTGTAFGNPVWFVHRYGKSLGSADKSPVRQATEAALPAYTPTGTDENHILTGNANGALLVDGILVEVSKPYAGGILLRHAVVGADNGACQVLQVGDGSNPFILRKRADWMFGNQTEEGFVVAAYDGRTLAGNVYNGEDSASQQLGDFIRNEAGVPAAFDQLVYVDQDDSPVSLEYGKRYFVDNAGTNPGDNIDLELPIQVSGDEGKRIYVHTRYTNDPNDPNNFGHGVIKAQGSDDLGIINGGTETDLALVAQDDNLGILASTPGEWIFE